MTPWLGHLPSTRWCTSPDAGDISALQLLVPAAEPLVDAVRDLPRVGLLLPPHVSLGYPWRSASSALSSIDWLREQAAATAVMHVTLTGPAVYLPDTRGRRLVHVVPDPATAVQGLAARLGVSRVSPHLSVARVGSGGDVAAVVDRLTTLLPLAVTLDRLELSVRVDGQWTRAALLPLGAQVQ